jgi:hypothetical protein
MNVILMVHEITIISNPVVSESALPDFLLSSQEISERMRISAFDELNGMFEGDAVCGSEEKVDVLGHQDEGVNLESTLATITVEGLQEGLDIVFDNEQSPTLPG